MKKQIIISFLGILTLLLHSCYSYGPSHEPYNPERKELGPPPEKIVAKPDSKSEYMSKTFQEMKESLPEAEVSIINDSIKVLFPDNIIYKASDIYPSSDYKEPLETFALLLKKYKKTNILITGHTDNKGVEIKNKKISQERADIIRGQLISNGIRKDRLESWGIGSASPIAENKTETGRRKNRRVEFTVLYDEK